MLSFSAKELNQLFKPVKTKGVLPESVSSYTTDSRNIKAGDLYFALKGEHFDGHDFIQEALNKEACGIVYSNPDTAFELGGNQFALEVKDTFSALQLFARANRQKQKVRVIGITGSNGKTTTKEWMAQLAETQWPTHKTNGTKNNHIGVPLTLLDLQPQHRVAVIEMGMSDLGEIELLAELAEPDMGVITSVAPSHLERLGSVENVFRAKFELAQKIDQNQGLLFLNGDDPWVIKMALHVHCPTILFGTKEQFNYCAKNIIQTQEGMIHFELNVLSEKFSSNVILPALGQHNVYNCLAAIAVTHQLGAKLEDLVEACSNLKTPPMRLEREIKEGVLFINDAYNANPTSMEVALNVLEEIEAEGRKIFVCGDMLELGMVSELAHQQLGEKIYDSKVDVLITYGHEARLTAEKAVACGMNQKDVFICYEKEAIPNIVKDLAMPGDVVLLKGSRRNQLENILSEWRGQSEETPVS